MKTTVDIPDSLLEEIKDLARARKTTLRELLLDGLRQVLGSKQPRAFRLRDAAVSGRGVQHGVREGDWEAVRDQAYEGRGS